MEHTRQAWPAGETRWLNDVAAPIVRGDRDASRSLGLGARILIDRF